MDRKQALGTLHRLYRAYVEVLPYEQLITQEAFRAEVYEAFRILSPSVLGRPETGYYPGLCDVCHVAYGPHYAMLFDPAFPLGIHRNCCGPCLASLRAQHLVLEINGEPAEYFEQQQAR